MIQDLETVIGIPIWLFIQDGNEEVPFGVVSTETRDIFTGMVRKVSPKGQKIAVLIDSPGGDPRAAFQIARSLHSHCGSYDILVPKYAKSAATLLALGAENIFLSDEAELGPIDMQITDMDTEERRSVLEYVQSLERLEAYTLRFFDDAMTLLLRRTHKKVGTLLPSSVQFVTNVVRPLFENIDVVQYTQMARLLKVMEDYAQRLLSRKLGQEESEELARNLTSLYSDHGFVIDKSEAAKIGLKLPDAEPVRDGLLLDLAVSIHRLLPNMLGQIEEF